MQVVVKKVISARRQEGKNRRINRIREMREPLKFLDWDLMGDIYRDGMRSAMLLKEGRAGEVNTCWHGLLGIPGGHCDYRSYLPGI